MSSWALWWGCERAEGGAKSGWVPSEMKWMLVASAREFHRRLEGINDGKENLL